MRTFPDENRHFCHFSADFVDRSTNANCFVFRVSTDAECV